MGKVLGFQGKKKNGTVYGSKEACRTCPNRCTDGRTFKTVKFGDETHYVPIIMYGSAKIPLQRIPDIQQPMHYNAFGKVKRKQKRVVIFIVRDKAKQRLRMEVSEHPFGTIKHYDNAGYFLQRGKAKVTAEVSLMYLSYNMLSKRKSAKYNQRGTVLTVPRFAQKKSQTVEIQRFETDCASCGRG